MYIMITTFVKFSFSGLYRWTIIIVPIILICGNSTNCRFVIHISHKGLVFQHFFFLFNRIGPAVSLFQRSYFELMKRALRSGGIVCSQADTFWGHLKNVTSMYNHCKKVFGKAAYATSYVSTYPAGQIGFVLGSLDKVCL